MSTSSTLTPLPFLTILLLLLLTSLPSSLSHAPPPAAARFPWLDPTLPLSTRISTLLSNLTLAEKISLSMHSNPPLLRVGLPGYSWWSEGSHGVAWAGVATVFPSPIALAASFNAPMQAVIGRVVSNEARGKHNDDARKNAGNTTTDWFGLSFYAPNVNLAVHAQWGRLQECYGEDPYLTGTMASQYVRGLQGNQTGRDAYLQAGATVKHFWGFNYASGVEASNVILSLADMRLTYLVAFRYLVEAGVESTMCSYNAVNGPPTCAHPYLQQVLRDEFGFKGFVVSDLGAISDIWATHHWTNDTANGTALALNAGCDLNLGSEYGDDNNLLHAIQRGLTSEATLDRSLTRLFSQRIRLGAWGDVTPWDAWGLEVVNTADNRALAREAAEQGAVLLKNEGGFLPLSPSVFANKRLAVVGPNAHRPYGLLGNYAACLDGPYSEPTPACVLRTPLDGILDYVAGHLPGVSVTYDVGIPTLSTYNTSLLQPALDHAAAADVVVVVIGLGTCATDPVPPDLVDDCLEAEGRDRTTLDLPPIQRLLLARLSAVGTPIILVLFGGGPIAIVDEALNPAIPSILFTWYSGEEGGDALANLLFGQTSPTGRLPVTFPLSDAQLPSYYNESMMAAPGRSYRYSTVVPLYAFGYGLTYSAFLYHALGGQGILSVRRVRVGEEARVAVLVGVTNVGGSISAEVVQAYVSVLPFTSIPGQHSPPSLPRTQLSAFLRTPLLAPSSSFNTTALYPSSQSLSFDTRQLLLVNDTSDLALLQGVYVVMVGGAQPGSMGWAVDRGEMGGRTVEWVVPAECNQTAGVWWEEQRERQGREEEVRGEHRHGGRRGGLGMVEGETRRRLGGGLGVRVGGGERVVRSWAEMVAEHTARGVGGDMEVTLSVEESIAGGVIGTFTVC